MFASTVDVVTDSDRSDSSPDSPNIEGEFFSWGLEGELEDNFISE
jgi:hypothetical protein